MSKIFISYKRADKNEVFRIKDIIEAATGVECWIDFDGIESDAMFVKVIINAINEAEIVLFMYSKAHAGINDYENDWTIRELSFAKEKHKRIVFVNLDGTKLTDYFIFYYSSKQQVNAMSKAALDKLTADIRNWLKVPSVSNKSVNLSVGSNVSQWVQEDEAEAQYQHALQYYNGDGVEQDYGEALKWFRKAADQGYVDAQDNLGDMYYWGQGVEQDYGKAAQWYKKAAAQGNAMAQNNIGYMYQNGYGVEQDYGEAMVWYRKAADQGDADAQNSLGFMYEYGKGVEKDLNKAAQWYKKAADNGSKWALDNYNRIKNKI